MSRVCGDVHHYDSSYVVHPLFGSEVRSGSGSMTNGDSICSRPMDHPDWHTNGRLWWKRTPNFWQAQNYLPVGDAEGRK